MLFWIFVAIAATLFLALLMFVDDVRRDFVTNEARTSDDARDSTLRVLQLDISRQEAEQRLHEFVQRQAAWQIVDSETDGTTTTFELTHASRLFRFKDDVTITIISHESSGSEVHGHSASRMGVGDLGQNPRNLREILAGIQLIAEPEPEDPAN